MFRRENFKHLVESQGRKTSWLADMAGVSTDTVLAIMCGKRNPSLSVTKNWARALNVPEQDLWLNEDNEPRLAHNET